MHGLIPDYGVQGKIFFQLSHAISADSERFSVMAAGEQFNCENDGAIYPWIEKSSGLRRQSSIPLCIIEVLDL